MLWILIALIVFAGLTLWRASARQASAEAEYPPAGQFVEVDGTRVHYVEAGEGPPVVLIHGSSGNVNDWTFDMFARLSGNYRVIAFDRPGLGYTQMIGPNALAADQARLLADAAAAIGADAPIVVGHSYGGAIALAWALERPENVSGLLILAGASHPWDTGIGTYYTLLSHPISGPIMASLLAAWVPDSVVAANIEGVFAPQTAPDGYAEHFGPGLTLRRFSLLENARQRASLLPQIEDMASRYGEITAPMEILHGDADATVGLHIHSEPLSRAVPNGNLVVMEGVGHMPHHADPEAIVDAIDRLSVASGLR
ncbi:alpha/beta fold hydrolase [Hasllibacter sp. MH4015]|uniref:alpha/beta fold hydrolase n=1 Tax=Hasllibacter sp. MH4015 TaxID=2854029 RepID=UPI001CD3E812|nr:alpha/beta hydrolase [Hasllibacter sp. MH4015]